ncbi:hypothetical protein Neosp_001811 [[Neocosmospora] mangrovei]
MTIRCQDYEFKAHRAIVCPQSPFFKTALTRSFKEGTSGIVDLPEDDPGALLSFLEFLYTGTYSVDELDEDTVLGAVEETKTHILTKLGCAPGSGDYTVTKSTRGEVARRHRSDKRQWSPYTFKTSAAPVKGDKRAPRRWKLDHSARIYVLADKYDVPALRLLARERFFEVGKDLLMCKKTWSTASWESTAFFSTIVEMIYKNTWSAEDPLRKALQMLISMKTEDDVMSKRMREEMKLNGELAVGVMDYLKEAKKI